MSAIGKAHDARDEQANEVGVGEAPQEAFDGGSSCPSVSAENSVTRGIWTQANPHPRVFLVRYGPCFV
jgi:hypothetical protein